MVLINFEKNFIGIPMNFNFKNKIKLNFNF